VIRKLASNKNVAFSGMIGNILEWYDFTLYGYLAVIVSQLFFLLKMKQYHFLHHLGRLL
jgi:hypothetical protein